MRGVFPYVPRYAQDKMPRDRLAQYIDEQTGLPDLIEALELMLETHRCDDAVPEMKVGWLEARRKSVAALKAVKGKL